MVALSVEKLRDALDYDPGTGIFTRKRTLSCNPRAQAGMKAGSLNGGYLLIRVDTTRYLAHRLAWFYVHGQWPKGELDHVNGVKDDNRIANLREATRSQNMANGPRQLNNISGAKGVHYDKANAKWMAYIHVNRKFINLGRFESKDAAVAARLEASRKAFGDFARS